MEEALNTAVSFDQLEQLKDAFPTSNTLLAKAYGTALYLRSLAPGLLPPGARPDMREYDLALLYHSLNTARYNTLLSVQREHALLSASLLANKLGLLQQ